MFPIRVFCIPLSSWLIYKQFIGCLLIHYRLTGFFRQLVQTEEGTNQSVLLFCFAGRREGKKQFLGWLPASAWKGKGRLSLEFRLWLLRCVTQATFPESVILNVLICEMGVMTTSVLQDCWRDQMNIGHIYCVWCDLNT